MRLTTAVPAQRLSTPVHGFAATACTAVAVEAPAALADHLAWAIAGAMLIVAVTSWWPLRRTAARQAKADAKVVLLQTALDKALAKIRDFADSQGRFVGNLAQEIRAPLATVLIHADLLLARPRAPIIRSRSSRIGVTYFHFAPGMLAGVIMVGSAAGSRIGPPSRRQAAPATGNAIESGWLDIWLFERRWRSLGQPLYAAQLKVG